MKYEFMTVQVEKQVKKDLLAIAKESGVNLSTVIRWAVKSYLEAQSKKVAA